jgi:hypothetical protein
MASNFAQYTNGVQMPTGISEAGANVGRFAQQGLSSFGDSLGKGLETYNENVAKDQVLTEEAKALGSQIQQFAAQFKDSPEHQPFADSLTPYIDQLAKVPAQSLTQKMGTVTGVKAAFANIGNQLQAFEMMRGERLKRDYEKAKLSVGEGTIVSTPIDILKGKVGIQSNKTIKQNIDDYTAILDNVANKEGVKIDKAKAVADFKANIKAQIAKGVDLQGKPIDPALLGKLKDQMANEDTAGADAMAYWMNEDPTGAAGKRLDTLGKSANVQMTEDIQAKIDALKAGDSKGQATIEAINALTKEKTKIEKRISEGNYVEGSAVPTAVGESLNWLNKFLANRYNLIALARSYKIGSGGPITPDVADQIIKGQTGAAGGYGFSLAGGQIKAITDSVLNLLGAENLTQREKTNIIEAMKRRDAGFDNAKTYSGLYDKDISGQKDAINGQIEMLKKQLTKTDNAPAILEEIKKLEALKTPTSIGTSDRLIIGSYEKKVPLTIEQKETAMGKFFQQKYGYVPAGFREMFVKNTPEANFKTMETPYGSFFYDGSGWKQMAAPAKAMTPKEMGENAAYQFGSIGADGKTVPMNFANSGIYLSGLFKGTPEALEKFRQEYYNLSGAERSISRLIEINNMIGESMPWNAALQGEAKGLIPQLKAALRTDIIGVGTVSNYEQELINDVVADPTKFFSLEASDRAKLMVIADRIRNKIANYPTMYGLTVERAADAKQIEMSLRQDLLNSNTKSSLEQEWEARSGGKTGVKIDWDLIKKK